MRNFELWSRYFELRFFYTYTITLQGEFGLLFNTLFITKTNITTQILITFFTLYLHRNRTFAKPPAAPSVILTRAHCENTSRLFMDLSFTPIRDIRATLPVEGMVGQVGMGVGQMVGSNRAATPVTGISR